MEFYLRLLLLPILPIMFAYLELGGNWHALRMLQKPSLWHLWGLVVFSVGYVLVVAIIAYFVKIHMGLLMVSYGFGFAFIAIFLELEWGSWPSFSSQLIGEYPLLWGVCVLAIVGFIGTSWLVFVIKAPPV